jgi:hypothetical protein
MLGRPAAPDTPLLLLLLLLPGGIEVAALKSKPNCPAATTGVPAVAGVSTHVLPCCCGLLVLVAIE